jgi:DNA polymerase-1
MLPDILGKLSIPYFVINGKEADDSIASLVSFFERWGFSVDIYTSDSDMFQLISDRTNVITFKKGITDSKRYDVSLFEKEFSFHPNRYVDYKSLVGDQADNIPGVNGIGPKTAASLVKEFDTGQLIDRFGDVFRRNLDLIRLEQFEVPLNVFLCRVKPCTDFSVLEQLQFQSLTPSYRKLLEPIVAQTGLFGLENVDTLPWQQLTDRIDVKEPFPFAFVSGNEPLFSSALLYAESNWKLKNESIPVNVFLNGEKVDISAGVTVALLNACSTCKLEGDTLWLQV